MIRVLINQWLEVIANPFNDEEIRVLINLLEMLIVLLLNSSGKIRNVYWATDITQRKTWWEK